MWFTLAVAPEEEPDDELDDEDEPDDEELDEDDPDDEAPPDEEDPLDPPPEQAPRQSASGRQQQLRKNLIDMGQSRGFALGCLRK